MQTVNHEVDHWFIFKAFLTIKKVIRILFDLSAGKFYWPMISEYSLP